MTERKRVQVAIIGAGFSGSILARILSRLGYSVLLVERSAHPRFALGESSTPLANLCLERLSGRYGLPELHHLAAHGRWLAHYPELRRGLKRGFTFYHHEKGAVYRNGADNRSRLLVAASPSDEVADTHWLRQDLDAFLVDLATADGVEYRDMVELDGLEMNQRGVTLKGRRRESPFTVRADFLVDASGPRGLVRQQGLVRDFTAGLKTNSSLLFGHFEGVREFGAGALEAGAELPPGPYPDDWAAVHHLFAGGWMYQLRFDHGLVSAGFLDGNTGVGRQGVGDLDPPAEAWRRMMQELPSVETQFEAAQPIFPIGCRKRIQHRLSEGKGRRWVALPHTFAFVDPLFSTGIAWSLLGVERLALAFESRSLPPGVDRYAGLLQLEVSALDNLIHGAYLALGDFRLFTAHSMLYFTAASWAETTQRLLPSEARIWEGFLGAGDDVFGPLFAESGRRLTAITDGGLRGATVATARAYSDWVSMAVARRNIAGLADSRKGNLYGVDLGALRERANLLGMSPDQVATALPRLRGRA